MHSKKSFSADNQQERLKTIGWIVGYIDGEGCFSVSFNRNKTSKSGWQIFPEFVVTQGEKSVDTLYQLKNFFDCGQVFINRRHDNHREPIYRYCVRSLNDLMQIIIPFFKENRLKTAKKNDFDKFSKIVDSMINRKHLSIGGMKSIAKIAETMNRKTKSKFLESSETICQNSKKLE
jgi:hypothetical protein